MSNSHRIEPVPSIDLQRQWLKEVLFEEESTKYSHVMTKAAQWGYWQHRNADKAALQKARDEELEACYEWLCTECYATTAARLRAARRPEPKTQAEKALEALDAFKGFTGSLQEVDVIRAALKRLRELEKING